MKLQGKTAIITGAAKGIGAAAARRFAAEGARIVLADKDEANGHEVAKAIVKEGGEAAFCLCDVGNEADVQAALDTAARTYGKLDIVVNNAGWQLNKTLLETTAEEFNAVLNTNLTSMFLFTKGAANMFIAQKTGGAIVNVCSTFAVVGSPGYVAYHASKGGVASFTRAAGDFPDAAQYPRQRRRPPGPRNPRIARWRKGYRRRGQRYGELSGPAAAQAFRQTGGNRLGDRLPCQR